MPSVGHNLLDMASSDDEGAVPHSGMLGGAEDSGKKLLGDNRAIESSGGMLAYIAVAAIFLKHLTEV